MFAIVCLRKVRHWKHAFLRQFTDSLETVHRQTVIWDMWARAPQNMSFCPPVCLSVCESVCLSISRYIALGLWPIQYKSLPWSKTWLFQTEMSPSQNDPNWSTQRKYIVMTLDHPSNSGGERVCPVFQGLWAQSPKSDCMAVCLPQAFYPFCLKFDFSVL